MLETPGQELVTRTKDERTLGQIPAHHCIQEIRPGLNDRSGSLIEKVYEMIIVWCNFITVRNFQDDGRRKSISLIQNCRICLTVSFSPSCILKEIAWVR